MSPNDPIRRFTVLITSTSGGAAYEKTVDAAYWQHGLATDGPSDHSRYSLIVFKDQAGKPVFAVRTDLVEAITEEREPQATITATAGGNVRLCTCTVMTGGYTNHRHDCPMAGGAVTTAYAGVSEVAA